MENAGPVERETEAKARLGCTLRSKWHLDALLGVGGMAAVYSATHRNGKRGAVKILHHRASEPETRRRFLREGRIANRVDHDGIVSVIDDDVSEDGSPFLVMELLEGESFAARAALTGNKLAGDVVLLLVDQVLDALAAAHDKGIIHRDIKPENLFITSDSRVKVLDFGIAHLAEPTEVELRTTQLGAAMGTPAFMAPEQARGRWDLVGPESDLWSLGATMFTLLTSELVHEEPSLHELLAATITKPARSLAAALPNAPAAIVEIVDRALKLKIADRWHDARDMRAAVRAAYLAITGNEIPMAPPRRSTPDDTGPRVVVRRDGTTMPKILGTISAVSTQLAATPRLRQRNPIMLGALVVALAIGTLVTFRTSASEPVLAAQSFGLPPNLAEANVGAALPAPTVEALPTAASPISAASGTTSTTMTATTATGVRPITTIASSTLVVAPSAAALRPIERNPKTLFDRRR